MAESESQRRANAKYKAAAVKQVKVNFFPKDADAYEHYAKQPKKSEYIIKLIRDDMNRS